MKSFIFTFLLFILLMDLWFFAISQSMTSYFVLIITKMRKKTSLYPLHWAVIYFLSLYSYVAIISLKLWLKRHEIIRYVNKNLTEIDIHFLNFKLVSQCPTFRIKPLFFKIKFIFTPRLDNGVSPMLQTLIRLFYTHAKNHNSLEVNFKIKDLIINSSFVIKRAWTE